MAETNVLTYNGVPILVSREPEALNERYADYSVEEQKHLSIVFGVEELE